LRDVCVGLSQIHKQQLVHLDIKPENLLISASEKVKIGDLGLTRNSTLKRGEYFEEGDARYLAPELLNSPKEQ
jgi:serine/threonine-protein kinase